MQIFHLTPKDNIQNILNCIDNPATIYLSAGIYRQKTEIKADNVTVIGESRETTIITYGDYARKQHADGKEYNTFRTYTLCISGENVTLKNLTVENSNTDPQTVGQCVALSVNAKRFYAENVNLKSTQDTLFLAPFPDDLVVRYRGFIPENQLYMDGTSLHLFKNCRISGTVDFIFGGAEAYFKDCEIISLHEKRGTGYIAAPCHHLVQNGGFYFINCYLKNGGADENTVFLARPWRDFGKCAFIDCRADGHIRPELFDKWNDTERDKTARFSFYNLNCAVPPEPVGWCRQLTEKQASDIIDNCNRKFTENNR